MRERPWPSPARSVPLLLLAAVLLATTLAPVPPAGARAAADRIDHVVLVSVDGLHPGALARLGSDGAPTYTRLRRRGAWTFNARTTTERTTTLPNHTSMLTGRRVARSRGGHGVGFNRDVGITVHQAAHERVASLFDVTADAGRRSTLFAAKDKFAMFERSWPALDRYAQRRHNGRLTRAFRRDLASAPGGVHVLHLSAPDVVGHRDGWMSGPYLRAVQRTDVMLRRVIRTINTTPALRGRTALVVTSDHGGTPGTTRHGDPSAYHHYRVPFLVAGPGVARGENLYRLNERRHHPGTGRPGYADATPVRNGEAANLALDLLGLPAVPDSLFDARQQLRVSG